VPKCKGCEAEIAWIKTVSGRAMPVNPEYIDVIPGVGDTTIVTDDGRVVRGYLRKEPGLFDEPMARKKVF
jgi:hypothetical protein